MHYLVRLILSALVLLSFVSSYAQSMYDPQSDTYIVGLPAFLMDSIVVSEGTTQEKEFWCWAASAQALLASQGIEISQRAIVEATMGAAINAPATEEQVLAAVDGHVDMVNGQRVRTRASFVSSVPSILEDLREGRPLIVGFTGHAYVLSAAEYRITPEGRTQILNVVLRDPWPDNPSRQTWNFLHFFLQDPIIIRVETEVIS